jgi:hypothetical protein
VLSHSVIPQREHGTTIDSTDSPLELNNLFLRYVIKDLEDINLQLYVSLKPYLNKVGEKAAYEAILAFMAQHERQTRSQHASYQSPRVPPIAHQTTKNSWAPS